MTERADHVGVPVPWRCTGARVFVHAAQIDGAWWTLRHNGFPDHPMYTLFVGGVVAGDVQDVRTTAPAWDMNAVHRAPLTTAERDEVLAPLRGLGPYGAEAGLPCDGDWCGCPRNTDEYIRWLTDRSW
jgi:hypothetical protein